MNGIPNSALKRIEEKAAASSCFTCWNIGFGDE